MNDFGMKLRGVELALLIGDRGEGRPVADRNRAEAGGQAPTRSPWLIQTWWRSPGFQTPSNRAQRR